MSDQIADLYVLLTAKTAQFNADLAAAGAKADATSASMAGLGKAAMMVGTAAIGAGAALGVWAVEGANQLEQSLTKLQTQAGASADEVKNMNSVVLQMAGQVGAAPVTLSDALFHIESAGYRGAQAVSILRAAAEGAAISGANLTDVTNALDAAVVSGIKGSEDYTKAMGAMNAIVGSGDMQMQDLADAMGTGILASAKTFGLSLTDIGAALATFGDNNIRGSEAATKLRMAITLMGAPSPAAQKALGAIGLQTLSLADDMRQPNGLIVALDDLQSHLSHIDPSQLQGGIATVRADMGKLGLDSAQVDQALSQMGPTASEQADILSRAFGGGRTASAVLLLLTQLDRVKSKYGEIDGAANTFGSDWQTQQDTLNQRVKDFDAGLQSTRDHLGEMLTPAAKDAFGWLSGTALPGLNKAFDWAMTTGVDDMGKLGQSFTPVVEDVGKLGSAVAPVAGFFAHELVDGASFLVNHVGVLETIFGVWAAHWGVLKALSISTEITRWTGALQLFAAQEGGVSALSAALGMGGTQGVSGAVRGLSTEVNTLGGFSSAAMAKVDGLAASTATAGAAAVTYGAEEDDAALATMRLGTAATQASAETSMGGFAKLVSGAAGVMGNLASGASLAAVPIAILAATNWDQISAGMNAISGGDTFTGKANVNQGDQLAGLSQGAGQIYQGYGLGDKALADLQSRQMDVQSQGWLTSAVENLPFVGGVVKSTADATSARSSGYIQNAIDQYNQLSGVAKNVWGLIEPLNQQAANSFANAWIGNGGDALAALKNVQQQFPEISSGLQAAVSVMTDKVTEQWQGVTQVYGQGSKQDQMYLASLSGSQRDVIQTLSNMAGGSETTMNQIIQGAQSAGVAYVTLKNGAIMQLTGSLADMETEWKNVNQAARDLYQAGWDSTHSLAQNLNTVLASALSGVNGQLGTTLGLLGRIGIAGLSNPSAWAPLPTWMHHAEGTPSWSGGLTWVGERGPELVNLPQGSQIFSNTDSANMLSAPAPSNGGGGGSGNSLNIANLIIQGVEDPRATAVAVREELILLSRSSGVPTLWGGR